MFQNPSSPTGSFSTKRHPSELILIILLLLSAVGIALTDFAPAKGFWYWVSMAPVFCAASIAIEWSRLGQRGESKTAFVRHQIIHWLGYLVAVHLVFLLNYTGRLNNADAGLVALLVLALATFCAGIFSNWRITIVGVFLGTAVIVTALIEEYIWVLLIPLLFLIIGAFFWRYRKTRSTKGPGN
ncbi:MAG: hypothetical protein JRL30_17515 [Deltaproteobacteria bacterium]|nr:hypothetical protein [Deltaproteobacteria bacterium]